MIEKTTETQNLAVKASYDTIYLVICGLHGIVPEQSLVEQMDLTALYRVAKNHSLTAIVCMELEFTNVFSVCRDEALVKKWKDGKEKAIRKNMTLDAERKEILSFMEKEKIWYMPLKGIILKEMYPKLGMRQMADNDILFDKQYQNELLKYMTERGYEPFYVGKGNHDVYRKAPVYNYEFHTALYGAAHDSSWEKYYLNVKQQLIKDEGNSKGYHFSDEDFYIYILTHAYKHYNGSGTGLRTLLDIYVFLQQKETKLNWNYIALELDKLRINEFERESRELCKKLFSERPYQFTQKESETVSYYLGSGTYGTMKNRIEKKLLIYKPDKKPITAGIKIKYYLGRLIPDREYYKKYVPLVYKYKWSIPFFLAFRVLRGLIRNGKMIRKEIHLVHKI